MRIRTVLAFGLLLMVGVTGCSRGDDGGDGVATTGKTAAPSASASVDPKDEQERMLKFSQCMRDNGVPEFPDPTFDGGGTSLGLPAGVDPAKVDAAQAKCKHLLPNGGEPQQVDAKTLEKMRKYAECMRANGVPKFPDPSVDGGFKIEAGPDLDPENPTFKAADEKCQQYMPAGPDGGKSQTRNDG